MSSPSSSWPELAAGHACRPSSRLRLVHPPPAWSAGRPSPSPPLGAAPKRPTWGAASSSTAREIRGRLQRSPSTADRQARSRSRRVPASSGHSGGPGPGRARGGGAPGMAAVLNGAGAVRSWSWTDTTGSSGHGGSPRRCGRGPVLVLAGGGRARSWYWPAARTWLAAAMCGAGRWVGRESGGFSFLFF
jgi:hypothetical protein